MPINITGHHLQVTPALRHYVEEKLKRLEKHADSATNLHVVFDVTKTRQKVEATMHVGKKNIFATAENQNMYAAIDDLTDKLDRQIIKYKERSQSYHRDEGLKNRNKH